MPETPERFHERVKDSLRMPPVEEWDTFPFDGEMRPRALRAPEDEPKRHGEGGVDCHACRKPDSEYVWTDENWRLYPIKPPNGLPIVLIMESREHYSAPGDLPDELAADLGLRLAQIERAVSNVPGIGRVHVCRWGDGGEHLHWWFMARPAGFPQLLGNFAAIWDDILPPVPEGVWNENVRLVVEQLNAV